MNPAVRLGRGVEIMLASGETIHCDGAGPEPCILSHAHGDHLIAEEGLITSELTAALAGVRAETTPSTVGHPAVALHNAGHIVGSRAATITDPETGRSYLYTGDCCTRDRFYLSGFDPPSADVLILESTYGLPQYDFPPTAEVVAEIQDWLSDTMDEVVMLFGYALGRAQKLLRILAESQRDRVFITDAVAEVNAAIEEHRDIRFPGQRFHMETELEPGDAVVLPTQTSRLDWIESLIDRTDAVTAGVSGWAVDDSFVYRRGYDRGFTLSDHCDFGELLDVVRSVDPDRVYTHHGFAEELADAIRRSDGYETRALKRNQSTLAEF